MKGKNKVLREILGIVIASFLMAMVMSVGSATELPASNFSLEGNTWTLTSFIEGEDVQSPIQNTTITAYFEDGEIIGSAGCNGYFGAYTVDGNEITIGVLGSTRMTCEPEEKMQQEYQYLEMLGNVTTYAIEENQLTLCTDGNLTLVYNATEPQAPEFDLEGKICTLTAFIDGETEQSPIQNTTITAYFEDGEIIGSAGCNGYFGAYTVDGNEITIGVLGSTMMTCWPEEKMQQEYQYLGMLGNVTTYTIEGNQLTLSIDGNLSLVYNATEPPEFDLEGKNWTLNSSIDGETEQLPIQNTTITACFEDGEITGSAGCNNYFGAYTVDGNEITIGVLGSTMMTCWPEEVMQQEYQYHEMLGNVTTYTIEGNQLTLSTEDNRTLVYQEEVEE